MWLPSFFFFFLLSSAQTRDDNTPETLVDMTKNNDGNENDKNSETVKDSEGGNENSEQTNSTTDDKSSKAETDNNDNDNDNDNDDNNENNQNEKKDNGLLTVQGLRNNRDASPSPSPGLSSGISDMDDNHASADGHGDGNGETNGADNASYAASVRSSGSISIRNITMEMINEREQSFLQNEIWGWHTYNVAKEFERMGITTYDPNAPQTREQEIQSLLSGHHAFSDPDRAVAAAAKNGKTDLHAPLMTPSSNDNHKPKLPTYDAPTPSVIGSSSSSSSFSSSLMGDIHNRSVSHAASMALNHGRSQTQADLAALKRYRGQLADTRMGDTNYPRYRFTNANQYYELCETYTTLLVVPTAITDWELLQVAKFRRLGRIPALCWKSKHNNVAMFRCSQPKVGIASNRSHHDERLLKCIIDANTTVKNSILYIMDARPRLNAQANKIKGAGFENVNFYKNVILEFLNVHNIHAMRKSRKALAQMLSDHSVLFVCFFRSF